MVQHRLGQEMDILSYFPSPSTQQCGPSPRPLLLKGNGRGKGGKGQEKLYAAMWKGGDAKLTVRTYVR